MAKKKDSEKEFLEFVDSLPVSTLNKERNDKWKLYRDIKKWVSPVWYFDDEENIQNNSFSIVSLKKKFNLDDKTTHKIIKRLVLDRKINELDKDKGKYLKIRTCSRCGKVFDNLDIQENCEIFHHFGYGSKHDLERFHVDLCIDCYDTLIDTVIPLFKENPLKEEDIYGDSICLKKEQESDPF